MKRFFAATLIVAGAVATSMLATPTTQEATAAPGDPGYVTVMFGRSTWQATYGPKDACLVPAGNLALTLEDAVVMLSERGLKASGGVVTERTLEDERLCMSYTTVASWQDLARLRDTYNFTVNSQGARYLNMATMTDAERRAESIDTLPTFYDRGHPDAWGAFNNPNNKLNAESQAIVAEGFAFSRLYSGQMNNRSKISTYPYIMSTVSVNGGRCHDTSLPCSQIDVNNNRISTSPAAISRIMSPGSDQWGVVQFYRFVRGKFGSMTGNNRYAWDCTSPDWRKRWTRQPELYCYNTAIGAIDARKPGGVSASPADVARAWNILPWERQ